MKLRTFVFAVALLGLLAACCVAPETRTLAVTLRPQEQSNWCWAASGQMVMEFLGHGVSQCIQANDRFGREDCCNSPVPSGCNYGGWPGFDRYGFAFKLTDNAALSWDQVRDEIGCKGKPVAFSWHWNGGGGHMMVLIGYSVINGVSYVTINDPWAPNVGDQRTITYQAYISGAGYTHWNDFYDVTYVTPS